MYLGSQRKQPLCNSTKNYKGENDDIILCPSPPPLITDTQNITAECLIKLAIYRPRFLACILSLLSYKEAVATSVLSRRWRYVYLCNSITSLNFDGTGALLNAGLLVEEKSQDFVRSVDRAITLQETLVVDVFRILYNLNKTHSKSINKWLEFAFARKVHRLELNLVTEDPSREFNKPIKFYTFPYKFYSGSIDCKSLKSIVLNKVNLNAKAIEFFLHNCPLLEELSVSLSRNLLSLKIVEPPPSFKRLELSYCNRLKSVEIRHANLVHLKYEGDDDIRFVIEDVPLLASFSVGGPVLSYLIFVAVLFPSILPQLETFEIDDANVFNSRDTEKWYDEVKMMRLKQLVVGFSDSCCCSLLHVTKLMDASPCLERLVLKRFHGELGDHREQLKIRKVNKHFGLKHVEFKGYHGCTHHLEMVEHLLQNAENLESLVIDTSGPSYSVSQRCKANLINPYHAIFEKGARALATKQLKNRVPPRIKLEIVGPIVDLKENERVPAIKRLRRLEKDARVMATKRQR